MKSVTTFDNFPTFAENGSRNMNTESAKYQVGFVEADTFPAEWANYLFHGATKGVSDLNTAVQSIWQENINVIIQSGQTPNPNSTNQLYTAIQTFINNAILSTNASILAQAKLDAHPVGAYYWSSESTPPSTLFGGTWVEVKEKFIYAKGDNDTVGATGGSKTNRLTSTNQIPLHNHTINHTHQFSHTHTWSNVHNHEIDELAHKHSAKGSTYGSYNTEYAGVTFDHDGTHTNSASFVNYAFSDVEILDTTIRGTTDAPNTTTTGGASTSTSGNAGASTTSTFDIMPPYEVAYCWRRTA